MSDVETAFSLSNTLNSRKEAADVRLSPGTTVAATQRTALNGDGPSTLDRAAVDDDAVSVKADSEAETIIQSGREELSPEKRKPHIRHDAYQNGGKEAENGIRRAPKFGQPSSWQLGKRKRPDHDNDDSRPALQTNLSPRPSSPPPTLKQEKPDDSQVLSLLQAPLSPRADGATERRPTNDYPRKQEGANPDSRDAPCEKRRNHHNRSNSTSNGPDGESDLRRTHPNDRSLSPTSRSHKRTASDSIHASLPPTTQKKTRRPPPQPLIDQRHHPSENRASPFSASSAGSPPPNAARRLTSCETYPYSPIKQMQNKKLRDQNGRTRLARACAAQEVEAAKSRQAERPEDLNVPDNAGNTPLQIAALEGCAEIVKFLIDAGCDIHTKNIDRDTPLIDAVENGHLDVVKILLDAGANPRVGNAKGDEPYDLVPSDNENRNELRRVLAEAKSHGNKRRQSDDISGPTTTSTKDSRSRGVSAASSPGSPPPHTAQSPPPQFGRRKTVRSEATRNDLLWTKPTFENLRGFAAKGDMAGVATILNILQKADTESLIAAAKGGHDEVLGLLLGIGNPDPDPEPLGFPNHRPGHDTPMLAAIGRGNIDVIKLLLNQPGFDPTRKGLNDRRYFEIAQDRKGDKWGMEYNILREAYDKHVGKQPNHRRIESRSPRRSRDSLKVAKRSDRDSASPASVIRKTSSKSSATHRQSEDGSREMKLPKERKPESTPVLKDRSNLNKGSSREDSHSVADERDTGHVDRKQKIQIDSRSPRDSTPHRSGDEPVRRRRLIAGRPPPDHAKRRPSLMSSDSLSGGEDTAKPGAEYLLDNGHRSSVLKRARSSVSPKPSKSGNHSPDEPRDKFVKKRRIISSELSSHSMGEASKSKLEGDAQYSKHRPGQREILTSKAEGSKPSDPTAFSEPSATKPKHRPSDLGDKVEKPIGTNTEGKLKIEKSPEKGHTEAERERAEKARIKAAKDAEEAKVAAEKAAAIAREKAEEEDRKREEERKQREEEQKQEEDRKRKEAEQRRARQAEEEQQRKLEQERLRLLRLRREQEEQEQRRRDALPNRLRTSANLIGANDIRAKSHDFLRKLMPVLYVTREDLEPRCDSGVRDERWVLNFYVALLLATSDLQLSQYPSWEKRPATSTQRNNIWDCSGNMLSETQLLNPLKATTEEYNRLYLETKPMYEKMEHVFWVKCSDFMELVPHIPHLHGLHISVRPMHVDPEPSSTVPQDGQHSNTEANHTAHLTNGASKVNGIHHPSP